MKNELTLGSLFDGSGGFPLGGLLNGITPIWASEIEPFPILVTSKRIPFMKHYGDINTIRGGEIEPVDIITFGSPCTDMSVAGKRAGLDGKQSALFYEAIRIIKEMRCKTNGQYPRYIVWENVPGAFSSNKGEDFKAVLEAVIGIIHPDAEVPSPDKGKWPYADIYLGDGWSLAYRTIDAQFFGVAQRRRRIYLVADFRSECAGEILFECKGMSRNFVPSFSEREGTATDAENSTGETSIVLNDQGGSYIECSKDIAAALRAEAHGHLPCVMQTNIAGAVCFEPGAVSRIGGHAYENKCGTLRAGMGDNQIAVALENHPTDSRLKIDESGTVQTLTSRMGTGGMNVPLVMGERIQGLPVSENLAQTLMETDYKGVQCVCQSVPRTLKLRSGCEGGGKGALVQEDISATLGCNNDQTVFVPTVYGICSDGSNSIQTVEYMKLKHQEPLINVEEILHVIKEEWQ
ncbi:MAG: putative BsuMI modification methylase subunit YdiP [Firmicutes bacterium ADurb.Bin419]|nr:MAG: putative BsuMI modification methylase subunit YdiP [Firmicutes bacterium ADurb.Bin419]